MKTTFDKQLSVMLTTEQVNEIKHKSQARKISVSDYIRTSILLRMESEKDDLNDMVFPGSVESDNEPDSPSYEIEPYSEHSDDLARSNDDELSANEEYLKDNMTPIDFNNNQ